MSDTSGLRALVAEFAQADQLLAAARSARTAGYRRIDAYSPFAIEGLAEALGLPATRLPFLILAGGIVGGLGGFLLQYYASVIDYPINVGGRPYNSWPSFTLVTFEMIILGSALAAFLGMLALNRLPMPYHPLFRIPDFERASQDRFFLCIEAEDPRFDRGRVRAFLEGLRPLAVFEVTR